MEIFTHEKSKKSYVTDLAWQVLDPFASNFFGNDQKKELIASGSRFFASYKNGSDENFGVGPDFAEDYKQPKNVFSLAALAATSKRFFSSTSLILVANKDEQEIGTGYAIGLVAGNVILDESFQIANVADVYKKFKAICESSARVFSVHSDLASEKIDHVFSLDELLADKTTTHRKLTALKSEKTLQVAVTFLAAGVAVSCAIAGWNWYQNLSKKEAAERRALARSPAFLYAESVKTLLASDQLIGSIAGPEIVEQLGNFPVAIGGWTLRSVSCVDVICSAKWISTGGTYADFKAEAKESWGTLDFSSSGGDRDVLGDLAQINHAVTFNFTKSKLQAKESWPAAENYSFETGVAWQELKNIGWTANLKPKAQQGIPANLNAADVETHADAVYAMRFEARGQDFYAARQVLAKLTENTVIKSFDISVDVKTNALKFSINGASYVQK